MAGAEIRLLGKMAVFDRAGRPVELPLRKAQALLAFLALNPDQRHSRQRLAGLLWGDHGEEQARRSLTKSLTALRRSLGGDAAQILGADTQHVWLKSDAIHIDVEALRSLVTEDGESAVKAALALSGGELMEDFVLKETAFNDWLTAERTVVQRLQTEVLTHLTGACLGRRDGEPAVALAERLVGIDPLDEEAHRLLMRAHERAGRRNAALAQYQACKDLLARELGVAPEEATRALFEALKASGESEVAPAAAEADEGIPEAGAAERPSIAVLAFTNMSGDPDQDYFSDGVTEDIITELSRFRSLAVMARHSSFAFKGKALTARQVGETLGVHYILEGSVQREDGRLRITAQLIDAVDGDHLWAERYDRELEDLFDIRENLVGSIVATLAQKLEGIGLERAQQKGTENLSAYDHLLRGRVLQHRATRGRNRESHMALARAIELDPGYAAAYAELAWVHLLDFLLMWSPSSEKSLERGFDCARRAVALDQSESNAHAALASACLYMGQHERAKKEIERAARLNPNDTDTLVLMGTILRYLGRIEECIEKITSAMRLNPFAPDWYLWDLSDVYYAARRYEEAVATVREMESPLFDSYGLLAASYAQMGRADEARQAMRRFHEMARTEMAEYPGDDLQAWRKFWSNGRAYKNSADVDHLLDGLCKAGLVSGMADEAGTESAETISKAGSVERPTIAVLAFTNMSGDPEQEYFSDGVTEDIITELSRFRSLSVMARHSTFAFKGKAVTARRVGQELRVQYIVEGSVQRSGNRLRITAQLIDAADGNHLWAERHDREMEDLFEVRDRLVGSIVATLAQRLEGIGAERARRKGTKNLTAHDHFLRGRELQFHATPDGNQESREWLERAVELDPSYAAAYANLAWTHLRDFLLMWSTSPETSLERGLDCAQRAVALDKSDDFAHGALACACTYKGQHERAEREIETAFRLNPYDTDTLALMGTVLRYLGKADEAIEKIASAIRLGPFAPDWYLWDLSNAYYLAGRYDEAIATVREMEIPVLESVGILAASYAQAGQEGDARHTMRRFHEMARAEMPGYPGYDLQVWRKFWSNGKAYKNQADVDHLLDGLCKAGLVSGDEEEAGIENAEVIGKAGPAETPSIAVLPLANMSDDPAQAYFSDGITEDIITELSRFRSLQVVARSSTFVYRDQAVDVKDAGQALGASYLLEGSLRKAGKRLRLTAQLIDVETGNHVWAERYDRELEDIFAVQDELVHTIVTKLAGQLAAAETERSRRRRPENLTAYDYYLRGLQGYRQYSKESILEATKLLEKAVALDPNYAKAQALLAWCVAASAWWTSLGNYEPHSGRALSLAHKALELEPGESFCQSLLAIIHIHRQEFEQAREHLECALALNPHDFLAQAGYATYLLYTGNPQQALDRLDEVKEFEPFPPNWFWEARASALYLLGRYEDAIAAWQQMTTLNYWDLGHLAACYGQLGQKEKAQAYWAEMTEAIPDPILRMREEFEYFEQKADVEHLLEGLRKAGVTE